MRDIYKLKNEEYLSIVSFAKSMVRMYKFFVCYAG